MNAVSLDIGNGQTLDLTQIGPASATLIEAGTTFQLADISVGASSLICDVEDIPFDTPDLSVSWSPGNGTNNFQVTVSKAWADNGTTDYQVSNADYTKFLGWLEQSGFPRAA